MAVFEMVKYHKHEYPTGIPLRIEEIAAHFDITSINGNLDRSLHTEYSYGKRKWNSKVVQKFPELVYAQRDGVPQLWKNKLWAEQFADFIIALNGSSPAPKVIEIHPPFNDYTDITGFVSCYSVFEHKIIEHYPDVDILVENRCGSVYHGGRFVLSTINDLELLCNVIENHRLQLKLAYDVPQIFTAHNVKVADEYIRLVEETKEIRKFIGGVHLWGKKFSSTGRKISHCGDFNTFFGNQSVKESFLHSLQECFDDAIVRKMVLEVNSGTEDLLSIIHDLFNAGFTFI